MTSQHGRTSRPRPLASLKRRLRLGGIRGNATIGTAVALLVTAVAAVFGTGHVPSKIDLRDGGAWLLSGEKGEAVHVNGSSGTPDAGVQIGTPGRPDDYEVVQDGGRVIVRNKRTGAVRSVDTTNLEAGDAQDLGGRGFEVVLGGDRAYAVDRGTGVVKLLDADLRPVGAPVRLGGELGSATVDRDGTLWVVRIDTGEVIAVHGRTLGKPSRYGRTGDRADLSLVDGRVVVVNHDQGTVGVVTEGADVDAVTVVTGGAELQVPPTTPGPLLIVEPGKGRVHRWSPGDDVVRVELDDRTGHELGPAVVSGDAAYLPDFTTGEVTIIDLASGAEAEALDFGSPRRFDLFEKDGFVWVNDPAGAEALVIDAFGRVERIEKYRPDLPGLTPPSSAATEPAPPSSLPAPPTSGPPATGPATSAPPTTTVAPSTTIAPTTTTTVPPAQPPAAPVVEASAGDATVDASWAVAAGGSPVTGAVASIAPAPRSGPASKRVATGATVTFDGLANGTAYVVTVVLTSEAGDSQPGRSNRVTPQSDVPGRPRSVRGVSQDRHIHVSWEPAEANGSPVTEQVVTATPTGGGDPVSSPVVGAEDDFFELYGVRNGVTYTVTVTARTEAGTEARSDPSAPVRPAGPPGAPRVSVLLGYEGDAGAPEATVTITPPSDTGGAPITSYEVTGPNAPATVEAPAPGTAPVRFTVPRSGNSFAYTAVAVNDEELRSGTSSAAELAVGSKVVIDDADPGFTWEGPSSGIKYDNYRQLSYIEQGIRSRAHESVADWIDCRDHPETAAPNAGTWTASLPTAGTWAVDVFSFGGTGGHPYTWEGDTTVVRTTEAGSWIPLGAKALPAGRNQVRLTDQNTISHCGNPDNNPAIFVYWDTARWTYQG